MCAEPTAWVIAPPAVRCGGEPAYRPDGIIAHRDTQLVANAPAVDRQPC